MKWHFHDHIFAYYEPMDWPDGDSLCEYWRRIWKRYGWQPVIIGKEVVARHARRAELEDALDHQPFLKSHRFEIANQLRWCGFAQVDGVVADFDVFPRVPVFPPRWFHGFVNCDEEGGPGFIAGRYTDFEKIVGMLLAHQLGPLDTSEGKPHSSDMTKMRQHRDLFDSFEPMVRCYGVPDWREKPLVHFGNSYRKRWDVPKWKECQEVLRAEGAIWE